MKKKLLFVNGPNLNLLGKREPHIYGTLTFEAYLETLRKEFPDCVLDYYQSNVEGELVNKLQQSDGQYEGIIMNSASYSHTSIALADCIAAIDVPVVEVHISNVYARESYRHTMITASRCKGIITGFGMAGYRLAVLSFLNEEN